MAKVFTQGQQLTNEDLVFRYEVGGVATTVDTLQATVFWTGPDSTGTTHEIRLNDSLIMYDSVNECYWLDTTVSFGLSPGTYLLRWVATKGERKFGATDEFSVVNDRPSGNI